MRLDGKVALVTGAGSGIGRATALLFGKEGARVVASDMGEAGTLDTVDQIKRAGGEATPVTGDVTDTSQARQMVETAVDAYGGLDVLVNSAGVNSRNALGPEATPEEVWDKVIDVNLKGTYLVSWHAVPNMVERGGGSIVNLASIMSLVGYPPNMMRSFDPYPPSKGGILQFTKNLAIGVAAEGVRVNCICPGYIWSNLTQGYTDDSGMLEMLEGLHPMGRLGRPEEVANVALYLSSDESSFVTGTPVVVDGGYTAQ